MPASNVGTVKAENFLMDPTITAFERSPDRGQGLARAAAG